LTNPFRTAVKKSYFEIPGLVAMIFLFGQIWFRPYRVSKGRFNLSLKEVLGELED
jgi:hypothetical protein